MLRRFVVLVLVLRNAASLSLPTPLVSLRTSSPATSSRREALATSAILWWRAASPGLCLTRCSTDQRQRAARKDEGEGAQVQVHR